MEMEMPIFTGSDAALAYALSAERIFRGDHEFFKTEPACKPIFVSLLFQSLEISIKHAGVESDLFTIEETRRRQHRSGHGIKELAGLAVEKLGGDAYEPLILAMTYHNKGSNSKHIIKEMITGEKLENTRNSYALRDLGYAQVENGDFAIIYPVEDWIAAVKETAINLPSAIDTLTQWKASPSKSEQFAIWLK